MKGDLRPMKKIEHMPIFVIKKDGQREVFDSSKIMNGLLRACEKRPVDIEDMELLVEDGRRHSIILWSKR